MGKDAEWYCRTGIVQTENVRLVGFTDVCRLEFAGAGLAHYTVDCNSIQEACTAHI